MLLLLLAACTQPPDDSDAHTSIEERLLFRLPLATPADIKGLIGMDHDPEDHSDSALGGAICTTYDGRHFPGCYDGHDGSDYLLDGGFSAMDAGSTVVVAAADGTVIDTHDGEYDRCHPQDGVVTCDGHPIRANYVIVEHVDGLRTLYWHLMRDSVAVAIADEVVCGQALGVVGSSGMSSTPHLHFEVQDADGVSINPYAGSESQEQSYWVEQGRADKLPADRCQ